MLKNTDNVCSFGFVLFYGISTFVGYLTPNPSLCKLICSIQNNSV